MNSGCIHHPDCDTCPFADCIASPEEFTGYTHFNEQFQTSQELKRRMAEIYLEGNLKQREIGLLFGVSAKVVHYALSRIMGIHRGQRYHALSEETIEEIRRRTRNNESVSSIAFELNISRAAVYKYSQKPKESNRRNPNLHLDSFSHNF